MDKRIWEKLKKRLAASKFRSSFKLNDKDRSYFRAKGEAVIREHAQDFIKARLAPPRPANDTKQTPWRGHPVFVAQHATATCCRKCLERWHGIARGQALGTSEVDYIVDVLMHWLMEN